MTSASNELCASQRKAIKRTRAVAASLAGIVHGAFYLIPLASEIVGDETWPDLAWLLPLVSAFAAGTWAWHSAFACRLVGTCTLLTAPLILLAMLLPALIFEAPPRTLTIMVPIIVAALGILTLQAGSNSLDRMATSGRHMSRGA